MLVSHLAYLPLVAHQTNSTPKDHSGLCQDVSVYKDKATTQETAPTNPSSVNFITHKACGWQTRSLPGQVTQLHTPEPLQNPPWPTAPSSKRPTENTTRTLVQEGEGITTETQFVSATLVASRTTNNPISSQLGDGHGGLKPHHHTQSECRNQKWVSQGREHPELLLALGKPSAPPVCPPQSPQQWSLVCSDPHTTKRNQKS